MVPKVNNQKLHEDNLKAELYYLCKINNLDLVLEYKLDNLRVDAILINSSKEIKALVEVKLRKHGLEANWNPETRQNTRYLNLVNKYNIPFIRLSTYDNLDSVVKLLENIENAKDKIFIK